MSGEAERGTAKGMLRRHVLAARAAADDRAVAEVSRRLTARVLADPTVAAARVVSAYLSIGTEPPTHDLVGALARRGVQVLLPLLRPDDDLDWATYDPGRPARTGRRGLTEPTTEPLGLDALAAADVVLVPALAVDRTGRRLGRGGGSYDRALARARPDALVAALLYDDEVVDEVPTEAHDRAVSAVFMPSATVRFGAAPGHT